MTTLLFFAHGQARGQCTITGFSPICVGSTVAFSGIPTGGSYYSSNSYIATVGLSSGIVTAVASGTATITYHPPTASADPCTYTVDVIAAVAPITSSTSSFTQCLGSGATVTLGDATPGGAWSSSDLTIASISATGLITPHTAGTVTMTYTITAGCYATVSFTIIDGTPTIWGSNTVCKDGTTTLTGTAGTSTTWSSSNPAIAAVTAGGGVVTGVSIGAVTITYSGTFSGCPGTVVWAMNVVPNPTVTASLPQIYCAGTTGVHLIATGSGGTGALTYSWAPTTYISPTTGADVVFSGTPPPCVDYICTVTVTDINLCTATATTTVAVPSNTICQASCDGGGPPQFLGHSGTISADVVAGKYYLDNPLTINSSGSPIHFLNAIVEIKPNMTIIASAVPATTVNILNSHFYSCATDQLWTGFKMLSTAGASSAIQVNNSLIEDAQYAVTFNTPAAGATFICGSTNSIFNRNQNAIAISSYHPVVCNNPIMINSTVFTSRDISLYQNPSTLQSYPCAWPDPVNEIMAPWGGGASIDLPMNIDNPAGLTTGTGTTSYAMVNCKDGTVPFAGLNLSGVGLEDIGCPGIFINGYSTLPSSNPILFDNMNYGIKASSSNVTIKGCYFSHLPYTSGINPSGIGIYATNASGSSHNFALDVNGSSLAYDYKTNYFYNCNTAVYGTDLASMTCNFNKIYSDHTTTTSTIGQNGYYFYSATNSPTAGYNVTLANSRIENVTTGINYQVYHDNNPGTGNIHDNQIIAAPASFPLGVTTTGISANRGYTCPFSSVVCSLNIYNNEVALAYNGVITNQFNNSAINIDNNKINVRNAYTTQYGIKLAGTLNGSVTNNYVTGENATCASALTMLGFDEESNVTSGSATITCNNSRTIGKGFSFVNANPTSWMYNNMDGNKYGLYLSSSALGNQGDASTPCDNSWNTASITWETYAIGITSSSSELFVRLVSGYDPTTNFGFPSSFAYATAPASLTVVTSPPSIVDCYLHTFSSWRTTSGGSDSAVIPYNSPIPVYEYLLKRTDSSIAAGLRTDSLPDLAARINWISQMAMYEGLLMDTSLVDSTAILRAFATLTTSSRYARIIQLSNSVAQKDYATAHSILSDLDSYRNTTTDSATGITIADGSGADEVVNNYKTYYRLCLKYLEDTLNTTDSMDLRNLSLLCPEYNGSAIYSAYSLYSMVFEQLPVFNYCDFDSSGSARHGGERGIDAATDARQAYSLFPNPNSGNITMQQYLLDTEPIILELYNSIGAKVETKNLQINSYFQPVSFGLLPPGLYLLHVTNSKSRNFDLKFIVE